MNDLHAAIMNLPCKTPPMVVDEQAYALGHRDARHAAAELVAAAFGGSASAPLTPDQRYWVDLRAGIIDCLLAEGFEICSDKDRVWLHRIAPPRHPT